MEVGVSFSVYDITVPVMLHGLNVMDDYLDHARALERHFVDQARGHIEVHSTPQQGTCIKLYLPVAAES
jgi:hypothetical protein